MTTIIHTVDELNNLIINGEIEGYIQEEEAEKIRVIEQFANEIAADNNNLKWLWIAGPSSAGKTTFTNRLARELNERGVPTHQISLDDYFLDRELTPKDAEGRYDYEHIEAIDLTLLERHLEELENGHAIEMPHFKFRRGRREFRGRIISLEPDELALIEGIHGLNPRITSFVDSKQSLKIYVCARTMLRLDAETRISTTNHRLLRRMVRDNTFRGNSVEKTFTLWPSVRAGEDRWIFPFQPQAQREFNSALNYEIAVLKPLADPLLRSLPPSHEGYQKAQELLRFLDHFEPIERSLVPDDSILHEFIDVPRQTGMSASEIPGTIPGLPQ